MEEMFKYSYSQNNLRSRSLVETLLKKTSISSNDIVMDIGAGDGAITSVLAEKCKKVIAVEADPSLATKVKQRFALNSRVTVCAENFLDLPLLSGDYKVFANIPFMRTFDIIRRLTVGERTPSEAYITIQKEAANKLIGTPRESLFGILMKVKWKVSVVYRFKRSDFDPVPGVEVVFVKLSKRERPLVSRENIPLFRDFVSYLFVNSTPILARGLESLCSLRKVEEMLNLQKIPLTSIPSMLSLDQWVKLFESFKTVANLKGCIAGADKKLRKEQDRLEKIHRTRKGPNWKST